jgi:hypothetical protein
MMNKKSLLVKKFRKMSAILRMKKNLQIAGLMNMMSLVTLGRLMIERLFHMKSVIRHMMLAVMSMKMIHLVSLVRLMNMMIRLIAELMNSRHVILLMSKKSQSCIRLTARLIAELMNKKSLIALMKDLVGRL